MEVNIQGMHCSNCAQGIEKHLHALGAKNVTVNFATSSAQIALDQADNLDTVLSEIQKLGYTVGGQGESRGSPWSLEKKFIFSLIWTIPLFMHMFVHRALLHNPFFQLFLCLPVFSLGTLHFGSSAWRAVRRGFFNMDVLIFLGITAAFLYSFAGTVLGLGQDYLFYETAATITTIVLFGNLMEQRSARRTTTAIEELSRIQPLKATRIISQLGKEQLSEINAHDIVVGERLLVNTGDKVPVDGEVYWGECTVDESMISGESFPKEKRIGDLVIGGTIVSSGTIKIKASAVGEHTVLAAMIRLVKQAHTSKPEIQRIGDKVGAVFVPLVVFIALAAFFGNYFVYDVAFAQSLLRSIAVLVIACPCSIGLATPTAVMVGIGRAAKNGILIKGGATLERLATVKSVVFDKTGTLSTGELSIEAFETFTNDRAICEAVLIGLERHSRHPIAKSIHKAFKSVSPLPFASVEELSGLGVKGRDNSGNVFELGSRLFYPALSINGAYDLYLFRNGSLYAALTLRDTAKHDAQATVAALRDLGLSLVLLSGDTKQNCENIASQTGIDKLYWEKLPAEKLSIIASLENEGATAYVGDGINDAAALARASVGISLQGATQSAIQSAQVVLLSANLALLTQAIALSRRTLLTIKQNLFWSFSYNVVAIPIAAAGMLNPIIASLCMAFSDIVVIGNSLRLRSQKL